MLNIYFCFPYRGVGGVSLLFLRIAEYFQQNKLANCFLVDYSDGFMAKNRKERGVGLVAYEDSGTMINVPDDAVMVLQSMTPWSFYPGIRPGLKTRLFFWNCHPFNFIPLLPGLRRQMQKSEFLSEIILHTVLSKHRQKVKSFIKRLTYHNALAFMDTTNLKTTEKYISCNVDDPLYLPVAIDEAPYKNPGSVETHDVSSRLRITWIGRIVDFKYYALKHALEELNRLQPLFTASFEVVIVGSGEYQIQTQKNAAGLANIKVTFLDFLPPSDVGPFLREKTDLLIAMGTSALEGARLGTPTLLLDIADDRVPDGYVFSWLFEREGFSLGDIVTKNQLMPGNNSLEIRLTQLFDGCRNVSNKTLQHFTQNHDLKIVAPKLLNMINSSSCLYGDLSGANFFDRGFVYSFFRMIRKEAFTK